MFHIIQVGMNSDLLQRLDALRPCYPDAANRMGIVCRLILEAHDRLLGPALCHPAGDNDDDPADLQAAASRQALLARKSL